MWRRCSTLPKWTLRHGHTAGRTGGAHLARRGRRSCWLRRHLRPSGRTRRPARRCASGGGAAAGATAGGRRGARRRQGGSAALSGGAVRSPSRLSDYLLVLARTVADGETPWQPPGSAGGTGISEWPSSRVRALGPEWTFDMDAARRAYTWLLSRRTHRGST